MADEKTGMADIAYEMAKSWGTVLVTGGAFLVGVTALQYVVALF